MIARRQFIALLGGAAAWPLATRAQQAAMPVIGFLRSTSAASSTSLVTSFQRGLTEAGFIEGQNVAVEYRFADDQNDRLPEIAAEFVRRPVAVIVANGVAIPDVKAATAAIPIVFTTGFDPVRTGFVASLSRPGGNITGVSFASTPLQPKRLELLHELVPPPAMIAWLRDPGSPGFEVEVRDVEAAARALGRNILSLDASSAHEIDAAFATIVQSRAGALLIGNSPLFTNRRRQLAALATRHGLPAISNIREFVVAGGLMSYGASDSHAYHRAGSHYVPRILKGANPGDLPVEMPSKFELVVNVVVARALGLNIPPRLLALADEVIE